MPRTFNTAGPCQKDRHYMIPPERRLSEVRSLIEEALFFVLHAPRQTGKTTLLHALAHALNEEGRYASMVVSVENLRRTTDVRQGNLAQGVEQLSRYLDRLGLNEGYLVLFDRRKGVSWDDKLFEKGLEGQDGERITVFGA